MVYKNTRNFVGKSNADILNAVRRYTSPAYQSRIPVATQATMQDTVRNLLENRPLRNEFVDALLNRIGMEIYRNVSWENPLAEFKIGMLESGDTIEEVMVGLIQATHYDSDRDALEGDVFGVEIPDVQSSFHKINRQNKYKLSINEALLRRAFDTPNGLTGFVSQLMQSITTSDNWDEFLVTVSVLREYFDNGGFFKVNVPDVSAEGSGEAQAKALLRTMRATGRKLTFLSTNYNAAGMPVAARPEDLVLITTPEAEAAVDVEALAAAFGVGYAEFSARKVVIPAENMRIPGAQAILTTKDFFVIADSLFETTSIFNPSNLVTNHWLHHHQVISVSRFVPAILFWTGEGDVITEDEAPVTGIATPTLLDSVGEATTTLHRGEYHTAQAQVTTTGEYNDAARYAISGNTSSRTRINAGTGALWVSEDENADAILVTAYAVNDDDVPQVQSSASFNVVGDFARLWPDPVGLPDVDNDGLEEVTPEALTKDADTDIVKIPSVTGVQYKKGGVDVANGSEHTITTSTTFTAVARSGKELAAGAPTSWTFTP